jgi:hypothetical protein
MPWIKKAKFPKSKKNLLKNLYKLKRFLVDEIGELEYLLSFCEGELEEADYNRLYDRVYRIMTPLIKAKVSNDELLSDLDLEEMDSI